jgi:hypothetical protein
MVDMGPGLRREDKERVVASNSRAAYAPISQ